MNTKQKTPTNKSKTRRAEKKRKLRAGTCDVFEICFTPIGALKARLELSA